RRRIVSLGIQEGDHVGALAAARQASKAHLGTGHVAARAREELVEIVNAPVPTLALHRRRIVEPALGALRPADYAIEIGADAVRLALAKGVAGGTFLRRVG